MFVLELSSAATGFGYNKHMYIAFVVIMIVFNAVLVAIVAGMVIHGYFMLRNRVPFVVLPDGAMAEVIRALNVLDSDTVYDLGCGDGRVILALRESNLHAHYVGVENDWSVWLLAKLRVRRLALIVRGEISQTPLADATRIFVYLGPQMMAELEPRFEKELPRGATVVSVQFPLPLRSPDVVIELPHSQSHAHRLFLYNY